MDVDDEYESSAQLSRGRVPEVSFPVGWAYSPGDDPSASTNGSEERPRKRQRQFGTTDDDANANKTSVSIQEPADVIVIDDDSDEDVEMVEESSVEDGEVEKAVIDERVKDDVTAVGEGVSEQEYVNEGSMSENEDENENEVTTNEDATKTESQEERRVFEANRERLRERIAAVGQSDSFITEAVLRMLLSADGSSESPARKIGDDYRAEAALDKLLGSNGPALTEGDVREALPGFTQREHDDIPKHPRRSERDILLAEVYYLGLGCHRKKLLDMRKRYMADAGGVLDEDGRTVKQLAARYAEMSDIELEVIWEKELRAREERLRLRRHQRCVTREINRDAGSGKVIDEKDILDDEDDGEAVDEELEDTREVNCNVGEGSSAEAIDEEDIFDDEDDGGALDEEDLFEDETPLEAQTIAQVAQRRIQWCGRHAIFFLLVIELCMRQLNGKSNGRTIWLSYVGQVTCGSNFRVTETRHYDKLSPFNWDNMSVLSKQLIEGVLHYAGITRAHTGSTDVVLATVGRVLRPSHLPAGMNLESYTRRVLTTSEAVLIGVMDGFTSANVDKNPLASRLAYSAEREALLAAKSEAVEQLLKSVPDREKYNVEEVGADWLSRQLTLDSDKRGGSMISTPHDVLFIGVELKEGQRYVKVNGPVYAREGVKYHFATREVKLSSALPAAVKRVYAQIQSRGDDGWRVIVYTLEGGVRRDLGLILTRSRSNEEVAAFTHLLPKGLPNQHWTYKACH
ncbi:hypothetical protein PENSPDRAFT_64333 [Peniophora sp. CONT]|nr:hypothetical protein PENSPDRAFT_64333 [Peniophora sp. CONT]